ncbi:hypothetical protein [Larkinella arboricola]
MAFIFNKHGVCENPEQAIFWRNSLDYFQITVAQRPDGSWATGSSHHVDKGGGGHGVSINGEGHATRIDAVAAEARKMLETFKRDAERSDVDPKRYRVAIRELEIRLHEFLTPQLSLF